MTSLFSTALGAYAASAWHNVVLPVPGKPEKITSIESP
jgi:hypothetical protein